MPTVSYFLRNQHLATRELLAPAPLSSIAYYCTTCGEVWGRIVVSGQDSEVWTFEGVPCEKHTPVGAQDWGRVPGSFLSRHANRRTWVPVMWWARALESLPAQVLERELLLHLNHFEKELSDA